jgi:hypothetical protein
MHTREGFPSPTEDPVIAALRAGYTQATADRVASRPSSVALPAALGHLALTRAVRSRRSTIEAEIAVRFLFALRPMSISGLQSDDLSLTATNAFIRLRREKGNRGHRRDRVLRFPLSITLDVVSKLLTSLSQCEAGTPLLPFSAALLNSHLIRLSRKSDQPPPPLGRFTCRSLRSGCISAAHTIGIPHARIMALSGQSSPQVLIRHYLDASIAPCSSAREMFGRLSSS